MPGDVSQARSRACEVDEGHAPIGGEAARGGNRDPALIGHAGTSRGRVADHDEHERVAGHSEPPRLAGRVEEDLSGAPHGEQCLQPQDAESAQRASSADAERPAGHTRFVSSASARCTQREAQRDRREPTVREHVQPAVA